MEPKGNLTLRQLLLNTAWTIPVIVLVKDTTSGLRWRVELWPIRRETTAGNPYHQTGYGERRVEMFAACDLCDVGELLDNRPVTLAGTEQVVIDNVHNMAIVYEVPSNMQ